MGQLSPEIVDKLFLVFEVSTPFLLAAATVYVIRYKGSETKLRSTPNSATHEARRRNLEKVCARVAEQCALSVLLPIVFLSALAARPADLSDVWRPFLMGALLPVFTIGLGYFLATVIRPAGKHYGRTKMVLDLSMYSTFGGGNRGTLLLLTMVPVLAINSSDALREFVVLDLGNFCILLFVMPWIMHKLLRRTMEDDINAKDAKHFSAQELFRRHQSVFIPLAFSMGAIPIFSWTEVLHIRVGDRGLADLLSIASEAAAPVLTFLLFFSIILRSKRWDAALVGETIFAAIRGYFVRCISLIFILTIFLGLDKVMHSITSFKTVLVSDMTILALLILALAPPSSLVPALIEEIQPKLSKPVTAGQPDLADRAAGLHSMTTIGFLGIMLLLVIVFL